MVRPGLDFFSLVFALFKAGVVPVLIDPGIGLRNLGQCCREAEPEVFIGIPKALLARRLFGWGRRTVRLDNPGRAGRVPACSGQGSRRSTTCGAGRRVSRSRDSDSTLLRSSPCSAPDETGGDPLHQRQHRPPQGRRLHTRHLSGAGRIVSLALRDRAR